MAWSYADHLLHARCALVAPRRWSGVVVVGGCALLVGVARPAPAMQVQPVRLAPATATIDGEFTRIEAVRELEDGRLLYTDGRNTELGVIDWTSQQVQPIGRTGEGPAEYRSTGRLHALPGDSTLMEDTRNGRWLVLTGSRVVGNVNYGALRRRSLPNAVGADGRGLLLVTVPYAIRSAPDGMRMVTPYSYAYADSVLLALEHRVTGRRDTIAHVRGAHRGIKILPMTMPGGRKIPYYAASPVGVEEQAVLFADGWVAVARAEPYRVDWRSPDGRWIRGTPLPFEALPMDERQKQAAVKRTHPRSKSYTADDFPGWPETLPPFTRDALLTTPDGHLVIRRMPDATRPGTFYDVVDRTGRLVRRLALAPNEQLIAIGRQAAYVVVTDDLDVQTLRRHPWR